MHAAAIDDPCKRIWLLYEPVDAFACVVRTAGARIMNGSEAPCKSHCHPEPLCHPERQRGI